MYFLSQIILLMENKLYASGGKFCSLCETFIDYYTNLFLVKFYKLVIIGYNEVISLIGQV